MTKTMCLRLAMALLPALILAACDESKPLQSVELKLAWQHGSDFVGFYAARKKGYFAEEGLDVNITPLSGPGETDRVFDKVAAGEIQFSLASRALLRAQARELPLTAIANIVKFSPAALFAREESGIVSPADLAGLASRDSVCTTEIYEAAREGSGQ